MQWVQLSGRCWRNRGTGSAIISTSSKHHSYCNNSRRCHQSQSKYDNPILLTDHPILSITHWERIINVFINKRRLQQTEEIFCRGDDIDSREGGIIVSMGKLGSSPLRGLGVIEIAPACMLALVQISRLDKDEGSKRISLFSTVAGVSSISSCDPGGFFLGS